jgi:hypothetical protein
MAKQITVQSVLAPPAEVEKDPDKKWHRAAWIGAGAGAAVLAAGLHGGIRGYKLPGGGRGNLIEAIKSAGKEEYKETLKAEKHADAESITRHAGAALAEWYEKKPSFHGATIHEHYKINAEPIPLNIENYNYHHEARGYYNTAVARHSKIAFKNPAVKDYVYRATPFDAANPPKPGRFMHPQEAEQKDIEWAKKEGKKRHLAQKEAEEKTKGKLPMALSRFYEFDVTLKEGRDRGGKFTSGGMPMLSPRDMQYAYHEPMKREQAPQSSKASRLAKYAVAGIGGAIGIGALIAGSAPLWQKRGAALAAEAEAKAAKKAARATQKKAQQAIQVLPDPELRVTKAKLDAANQALVAQEEMSKLKAANVALNARVNVHEKVAKTLRTRLRTQTSQLRGKDVIADTLRAVQTGGAKPIVSPTNVFGRQEHLYTHADAYEHFKGVLAGVEGHPTKKGEVNEANRIIMRLKDKIDNPKEGATPHTIAILQAHHDAYEAKRAENLSQLQELKKIPGIANERERVDAWDKLNKNIVASRAALKDRKAAGELEVRVKREEARLNALPRNDPLADAIAIHAQGYGAVSKRGGKPKSKNPGRKDMSGSFADLIQLATSFERLTLA